MIKKILFSVIFLCCLTTANIYAQKAETTPYDKVKFGDVSFKDFEVKPTGQDSAAAAIVLFKIGTLDFAISNKSRWNYKLEIFKRIKILNKEGYKYGDFQIPIFKNLNNEEVLNKIQIASYNLVNGKVVQNKAAKDEKFKDKFNENYTINKYTLSNIQEGTIVEIKYEIQSDFISTLRDWYFQEEIPIVWNELTFIRPEYFNYKINFLNPTNVKLIKDVQLQKTFLGNVNGQGVSGSQGSYNFDVNAQERRWVAEDVKAFKDEPYITTEGDFVSKIEFEILSTNIEGEGFRNYSQTWEKVFESYKKADQFGLFAKSNNYSKKLVSTIVNETDSARIKLVKIFNFVKANIKWNGSKGDFASSNSVKDVIETKTGNIGDINLTLINLLNTAGIKAEPIVLSTRDNGVHPGYPSSAKFNYVIASAQIDSTQVILDASNIYHGINMISPNALSHKGRQINLENLTSKWIDLDPLDPSMTSLTSLITFDNELKIKGNAVFRKVDYSALRGRKYFGSFANEADYLKDFKKDKNGLTITKYSQTDFENVNEPFSESFEFELQDYVEEAGNLVYFNPLLFEQTKQNPFKQESRSFPVDFTNPTIENIRMIINIPEGYTIDKLPESVSYKMNDGSMSFLYTTVKNGNQIMVNSKIYLLKSTFEPENYTFIKDLFKQIVAKQAQPIVLKKI